MSAPCCRVAARWHPFGNGLESSLPPLDGIAAPFGAALPWLGGPDRCVVVDSVAESPGCSEGEPSASVGICTVSSAM